MIGGIFGLVFIMYHHNSIMCVQRLMNFNGPRQFYKVRNFKLSFFCLHFFQLKRTLVHMRSL
jgi:hypothetical protein